MVVVILGILLNFTFTEDRHFVLCYASIFDQTVRNNEL